MTIFTGSAVSPAADAPPFVEDVFSAFRTEGDGTATVGIVNNNDLSDKGGLVWGKNMDQADTHVLVSTVRGVGETLTSETDAAEVTNADTIKAFNSDGFDIGADVLVNTNTENYTFWTFLKQARFFDEQVVSHTNGVATNVEMPGLVTLGFAWAKRIDGVGDWYTWHKDLTASNNLRLSTTAVESATNAYVSVSGTTLTISASADTGSYVVDAWAHDPLGPTGDGSDGMIACGTYTGTGSAGLEIDLGWEPQYVLIKRTDNARDWYIFDIMRGIVTGAIDPWLQPNTNAQQGVADIVLDVNPDGFTLQNALNPFNASGGTYIYMAIRRPMKVPTAGTEVFAVDELPNNSVRDLLFTVDMGFNRENDGTDDTNFGNRLTGNFKLETNTTDAQAAFTWNWDAVGGGFKPASAIVNINYMFARRRLFFDVVAYTGDAVNGRDVPHSLGIAPELMIVRKRDSVRNWRVYEESTGNGFEMILSSDGTPSATSLWDSTTPGATTFRVNNDLDVNGSGSKYVAQLWATLENVSKVFSYTGNGTNQTIDCGFTGGARFILIKRTDVAGDWFYWDSVRGIVAGDDPHLALNLTGSRVIDDSVDPDSSGFIVNQIATNINVTSATYIGLAIA